MSLSLSVYQKLKVVGCYVSSCMSYIVIVRIHTAHTVPFFIHTLFTFSTFFNFNTHNDEKEWLRIRAGSFFCVFVVCSIVVYIISTSSYPLCEFERILFLCVSFVFVSFAYRNQCVVFYAVCMCVSLYNTRIYDTVVLYIHADSWIISIPVSYRILYVKRLDEPSTHHKKTGANEKKNQGSTEITVS